MARQPDVGARGVRWNRVVDVVVRPALRPPNHAVGVIPSANTYRSR
jgi:hypothetical protein